MALDMAGYLTRKVAPGVHVIQEAGQMNAYLVEGETYAALIDSGAGLGPLRAVVEALTDLPVVVLNTHGHWDHIGGNHLFEQIGVHALDAALLSRPQVPETAPAFLRWLESQGQALPAEIDLEHFSVLASAPAFLLAHGQSLDLGGRVLQVWHTPGHTPGSVCLVDEVARLLFCGDTLYAGAMRLYLPSCEPARLLESLTLLSEMAWEIDLVLPGHGQTPMDGRLILEVADGLRRTLAGEAPMKRGVSLHQAVRIAAFERFMLLFPADWKPVGPESAHSAPHAGCDCAH